jgi:hypothetical protein
LRLWPREASMAYEGVYVQYNVLKAVIQSAKGGYWAIEGRMDIPPGRRKGCCGWREYCISALLLIAPSSRG